MLLHGDLILWELKQTWTVLSPEHLTLPAALPPPLLWQGGWQDEEGCLYVFQAPGPTHLPKGSLGICCGPQRGVLSESLTLPEADLWQVFNCLQALYARMSRWSAHMDALVEQTAPLQQLLDAATPVTGNLLTVTSAGLETICLSEQGSCPAKANDPWTRPLGTADLTSMKDRMALNREKRGVQWIRQPEWEYEFLYANLQEGKARLGTLALLPSERPLAPRDVCLLEHVLIYVQRLIRKLAYQQGEPLASLHRGLQMLLRGSEPPPDKLVYWQAAAGFDQEDLYRCLVIPLPSAVQDEYRGILSRDILTQLPSAILFSHQDDLVLVTDETQAPDMPGFFRWLESELLRADLFAGVSQQFSPLTDLPAYHQEAMAALGFPGEGRLSYFDRCRQRYVLHHCTGTLPPALLYSPGFCRVLEHNKTSAVDYLETLRVWLEETGNESRAAARLHICRNTFLYRKKQLTSLLAEELDSADGRFYLMLCLRLWAQTASHAALGSFFE